MHFWVNGGVPKTAAKPLALLCGAQDPDANSTLPDSEPLCRALCHAAERLWKSDLDGDTLLDGV